MSNKLLVLVTGANQGLGYYVAQQLAATNKHHVLIGSRDTGKAEKAIQSLTSDDSVKVKAENIDSVQIDVSSDDSIQQAAKTVEKKYGYLDILMVNAGIAYAQGTTREHYQQVYNTNVFGAAGTVDAFLPLLQKSTAAGGKRIAFTTSDIASFDWATSQPGALGYPIYASSKTALNMVMLYYAKSLEKDGFVVAASAPGFNATNLNHYSGTKDPRDGAKALIRAAVGEKDQVHGRVVNESEVFKW